MKIDYKRKILPPAVAVSLALFAVNSGQDFGSALEDRSATSADRRAAETVAHGVADVAAPGFAGGQLNALFSGMPTASAGDATYGPRTVAAVDRSGSANTLTADDAAGNAEDAASARAGARAKMSSQVALLAGIGGPERVDLVIRFSDHPDLVDADRVAELGGEVVRSYRTLEMQTVRLPASALYEFALEPDVERLSLDETVSISSVSSRQTANVPGSASGNFAYSGQGVGVAILDTGIAEHADLQASVIQYSFLKGAYPVPTIVNGEVTATNSDPREDLFGHGTHVAGIIAGSGGQSNNAYQGAAQQSQLLSLQVLDSHGNGTMSDIMAALDWLLTYGSYFDVRIANLSLGKGISESNTTDPLVLAVEALWDNGVVMVIAAGNLGSGGSMTIKSPGNSRKVITVGSLTDSSTSSFGDDYVSSFSSRGPSVGDYVMKPDLVAPGNRLIAAIPDVA
ncbi:MAG: S8 family serine peptidase, partial [Pseudomonadota bacterium]